MASTTVFTLLLGLAACGDKPSDSTDETGTAGETATDSVGEEDVGESGTATTTSSDTTSTDTDQTTTTTTDDGNCPIGSEGCPCTEGGGCDPGLACDGGTCEMPAATTDEPTTDTTDTTDTTTDTTDTGVDPLPYQACPNGDADCLPDEVCITGDANQGQLPWTMCTSGECNGDDDCAVDDNDICNDLPGDGEPIDYCVPLGCDFQNPCPDTMACAQGFGGGSTSVCVWPN